MAPAWDRPPFADRLAAGDALATELSPYAGQEGLLVLGLPRGGVPVAARVALALRAALDVLLVRKLGLPSQPELAMGAIARVGEEVVAVRNERVIAAAAIDEATFASVLREELDELRRRELRYRGTRPPVPVTGRTVIVVDDGLATGATMRAAVAALRQRQPARVVVAVPVASPSASKALADEADEVVSAWRPTAFTAVGQAYVDFSPTSDADVRRLLNP